MPPFIPESDRASTGPRWTKWKRRFENFLMNVTESKRKWVLPLHYIGETVYEILDILPDTGEENDYDVAMEKLFTHFTPKMNTDFQTYVFRQEN